MFVILKLLLAQRYMSDSCFGSEFPTAVLTEYAVVYGTVAHHFTFLGCGNSLSECSLFHSPSCTKLRFHLNRYILCLSSHTKLFLIWCGFLDSGEKFLVDSVEIGGKVVSTHHKNFITHIWMLYVGLRVEKPIAMNTLNAVVQNHFR